MYMRDSTPSIMQEHFRGSRCACVHCTSPLLALFQVCAHLSLPCAPVLLSRSSAGVWSLPPGVGSGSERGRPGGMEEGVKGLLSSMSFKQPSLSLLAPYSFPHPKEINQTPGEKKKKKGPRQRRLAWFETRRASLLRLNVIYCAVDVVFSASCFGFLGRSLCLKAEVSPGHQMCRLGEREKKRKWLISTMNSKVSATNFHSRR